MRKALYLLSMSWAIALGSVTMTSPHSYAAGSEKVSLASVRSSAEKGQAWAQFALARYYHRGTQGLQKSAVNAFLWYQLAALQGHAKAQAWLGVLYLQGEGVKGDDEKAFFWFNEAAKKDEPMAWEYLGEMYGSGRGTAKSLAEAEKWLNKAAKAGRLGAVKKLSGLAPPRG